jgi:regulator of protease activity HflC (stomatin/prohibitin superfamily)
MSYLIVLFVAAIFIIPMFVRIVKQGTLGMVETLGRFSRLAQPGVHFIIPGAQSLAKIDIREQVIDVPQQEIITSDNVNVMVDGIVYYRIEDVLKATYEINNVRLAVLNLAQTNLRSVLGTMSLDDTLSNRVAINTRLKAALDVETAKWGVDVTRVEIQRLDPPMHIQEAMSKQMIAERSKRAIILEAQGYKESQISRAEGDKQSSILQAEGQKQSQILAAEGQAEAMERIAAAQAKKIEVESLAADEFFKGNAITHEQIKVAGEAMVNNTKYILGTDIMAGIQKIFTK